MVRPQGERQENQAKSITLRDGRVFFSTDNWLTARDADGREVSDELLEVLRLHASVQKGQFKR